jgi:hypothetical protein
VVLDQLQAEFPCQQLLCCTSAALGTSEVATRSSVSETAEQQELMLQLLHSLATARPRFCVLNDQADRSVSDVLIGTHQEKRLSLTVHCCRSVTMLSSVQIRRVHVATQSFVVLVNYVLLPLQVLENSVRHLLHE